jgi:hypothetical protein
VEDGNTVEVSTSGEISVELSREETDVLKISDAIEDSKLDLDSEMEESGLLCSGTSNNALVSTLLTPDANSLNASTSTRNHNSPAAATSEGRPRETPL